jgi:predicted nucleic acid-binding protein
VLSAFLRRMAIVATLIQPQINLNVIEEDTDDNRVLECAVTGYTSYIITGDKHLLQLKEYQGIVILPPSGFLALLKLEGKKRS